MKTTSKMKMATKMKMTKKDVDSSIYKIWSNFFSGFDAYYLILTYGST